MMESNYGTQMAMDDDDHDDGDTSFTDFTSFVTSAVLFSCFCFTRTCCCVCIFILFTSFFSFLHRCFLKIEHDISMHIGVYRKKFKNYGCRDSVICLHGGLGLRFCLGPTVLPLLFCCQL